MITHHTGHVLDIVRQLPGASVDLVACSPPFLALRNYNDLPDQWGSEPTPAAFLAHLLELTTELRRVLAPHGSIAIELGDTYSGPSGQGSGVGGDGADSDRWVVGARSGSARHRQGTGWPGAKSLCGTPTLFAWSLAYGRNLLDPAQTVEPWLVRNVIVWARNNPPVGALGDKVRPAVSYITVATPSPRRWFDLDAVRTPYAYPNQVRRALSEFKDAKNLDSNRGAEQGGLGEFRAADGAGAPPLDHWHDQPDGDLLWLINTQGSNLSHYAMWPPALAERLILAMCPAQVCRVCGEPRRRLVGPVEYVKPDGRLHQLRGDDFPSGTLETGNRRRVTGHDNGNMTRTAPTIGWSDCGHDNYRPGVTLDPFAGTGTTLAAADINGRDAIGIDLDPANAALHATRWAQCWRALRPDAGPSPITAEGEQLGLLL